MITITFNGKEYTEDKYISMKEFLLKHCKDGMQKRKYLDNPIVAVLADGELLPLSARKNHSFTLETVRLFSTLGTSAYRNSLVFLLTYASSIVYPGKRLVIGHSLGDGYYCTFESPMEDTMESAARKLAVEMRRIVAEDQAIERKWLSYRHAVEYFSARGMTHSLSFLEYQNNPDVECCHCSGYFDLYAGVTVPYTGIVSLWELMPYGEGMLIRYPRSFDNKRIREFVDNPLLFSVFKEYKGWGRILGVTSVGDLNRTCYNGGIQDYIRLSESLQARKIASIADMVAAKGAKIVLVAGPSSSGKTTFAKKLCLELRMLGLDARRMSLDDYYLSHDQMPLDENGERDFEALEALDLDLIRHDLMALSEGKAVHLPSYSFSTHVRTYAKEETILGDRSVLVIEGIHGLNPGLCPQLDPAKTFKIFISALTQLNIDDHTRMSTTDSRLLRRIVRDNRARNTSCIETLQRWPSVLNGENKHIFPNQNNADVMINSALDYELGVLSCYAVPLLKTVKPSDSMHYTTSRRLLKLLDNVYPIPAEQVPRNSLLREFIGDGEFDD